MKIRNIVSIFSALACLVSSAAAITVTFKGPATYIYEGGTATLDSEIGFGTVQTIAFSFDPDDIVLFAEGWLDIYSVIGSVDIAVGSFRKVFEGDISLVVSSFEGTWGNKYGAVTLSASQLVDPVEVTTHTVFSGLGDPPVLSVAGSIGTIGDTLIPRPVLFDSLMDGSLQDFDVTGSVSFYSTVSTLLGPEGTQDVIGVSHVEHGYVSGELPLLSSLDSLEIEARSVPDASLGIWGLFPVLALVFAKRIRVGR